MQMEANYTSFFLLLLETQPLVLAEEGNAVSSLAKLFFFLPRIEKLIEYI